MHEIKPHAYGDTPAGLGFALSVIADIQLRDLQNQAPGLVLWCMTRQEAQEWGRPYGPGLLESGIDPARVLIVEARNANDAAFAIEEGLKSAALSACLAQTNIKTPLMARRLGLAARAAQTPCFLLTGHGEARVPGTLTRWRIATEASAHIPFEDVPFENTLCDTGARVSTGTPGPACWRLSLERSRTVSHAVGQASSSQGAQSAVAQETSAQVGQRPVAQEIREGARFHVQADHETARTISEKRKAAYGSQTALRVAPASSDRTTDTAMRANWPRAAAS
ncbi:MAG: hypothetical protein AAF405_04745 [Pseudomonadota bacterium]